ncbi:unnamed protein product [Closterium sp. NIES-53]
MCVIGGTTVRRPSLSRTPVPVTLVLSPSASRARLSRTLAPVVPASRRPCYTVPSRRLCYPVAPLIPSRRPCRRVALAVPSRPVAPAVPSPLLSHPVAPSVASHLLSRPVPSPLLSRPIAPAVASPLLSRLAPSPLPSRRPCCPVPSCRPCCPVASPPVVPSRPVVPAVPSRPDVPAVPSRRPPSVPPCCAVHPVPSRPRRASRPVPSHAPRATFPSRPCCALHVRRAPCALPGFGSSSIHLYASTMVTPRILRFDAEGRPLEFSVWLLRARRLLESQVQAYETLWAHASGDLPEPADPAPLAADSDCYACERADMTAWKSRDAAACIALSSLLPEAATAAAAAAAAPVSVAAAAAAAVAAAAVAAAAEVAEATAPDPCHCPPSGSRVSPDCHVSPGSYVWSGLPRVLPSLPPSLVPPCGPCVEGRLRTTPHSSSLCQATEPFETLHLDTSGSTGGAAVSEEGEQQQGKTNVPTLPSRRKPKGVVMKGWETPVSRPGRTHMATMKLTAGADVTEQQLGNEEAFLILPHDYDPDEEDEPAYSFLAPAPEEPASMEEAFSGPDRDKWLASRDAEIKTGDKGQVTINKIRLVAKEFMQKEKQDFNEIFAPTAKPPTLRVLLTDATVSGKYIIQMDISTAFLNGILEEYMTQPPGKRHTAGTRDWQLFRGDEDSSDYTFYHPPLHRFFDSRDVRFDESDPYYVRYPCRGLPVPPAPLLLTSAPPPAPPVQPPPPGPAPSGVSHATPPPSVAP